MNIDPIIEFVKNNMEIILICIIYVCLLISMYSPIPENFNNYPQETSNYPQETSNLTQETINYAQGNYSQENINYAQQTIDMDTIKNNTQSIAVYRPAGSEALHKIKRFVISQLQTIPGIKVEEQELSRTINGKIYSFTNIIGKFPNSSGITLAAHIDSPFVESPAATDAATSICIIIEIATKLAALGLYVDIVFFDGEEAVDGIWFDETSLSGSTYYVKNLDIIPKQVILLDLIGGDAQKNKIYGYNDNPSSHPVIKELTYINTQLYPQYQIFSAEISNVKVQDDTTPFRKRGIPATNLIPSTFPIQHHTANDTVQNINWKYVEVVSNVLFEYLKVHIRDGN
ncbi:MAG: glutaminyl peptide cyclotransferase [Gaeavirus sp.]|uniref:Glutaminyl peptide cyclotransferase n=1 Tax=Gaeavirus sp. TaxID=2487767 RepID=A0A3G4ZZE7_9VIRU|nr:MAG: glutaminyl peptide cyclotransferase [Gaeavirus sp.]